MSENPRAFPVPDGISSGMTLRDYFAAATLQGMMAAPLEAFSCQGIREWAALAYEYADAMLTEREKK